MEKKDCKLVYLEKEDLYTERYKKFLETEYSNYEKFIRRMEWYAPHGFKMLVAEVDGAYMGQSCGTRATAMVNGIEEEIWWSVDTFVVPQSRGMGIGKKLQKKLHEDLKNFSSVWYTPANGHLKRKCGAKEVLAVPFSYYPVSNFFTIFIELVWKKLFSKDIHFRINLPFFYYHLNSFIGCKLNKEYTVEEMCESDINGNLAAFATTCLKDMPFYIKRDEDYLKWKYVNGPSIRYKMLEIKAKGKKIGIVAFSEDHDGHCVAVKAHVVKIFDSLFIPGYGLSHKKLLMLVMDYFKKKGIYLDGIWSLQKIDYYPKLVYPRPSAFMLSTLNESFDKGYLTYLDQDMDQM